MNDFLRDSGVSAVVPTRNRPASLRRLLDSLARQTRLPNETVIVEASDRPEDEGELRRSYPSLTIRVMLSPPSLCKQRNLGIRSATGEFILLADDDIEFPPSYLASILEYASEHPADGAVSGTLQEPSPDGPTVPDQAPLRPARLLWSFMFQTSVWGSFAEVRKYAWLNPIIRFFERRKNTFTLAGWPLLTEARPPAFRTAIYGLGAAMVRRSWLLNAPYDERLDTSGIGDNFGVAIQLPGERPIVVLTGVSYLHHRSPEERVPRARAYALRLLALDLFLSQSQKFHVIHRILLRWSLLGSALGFAITGSPRMAAAALSVLLRMSLGRGYRARRGG